MIAFYYQVYVLAINGYSEPEVGALQNPADTMKDEFSQRQRKVQIETWNYAKLVYLHLRVHCLAAHLRNIPYLWCRVTFIS